MKKIESQIKKLLTVLCKMNRPYCSGIEEITGNEELSCNSVSNTIVNID